MKSLFDILFSNYFVIDETKMEIYEPSEREDQAYVRTEEQDDLISLISRVMIENERLQDIRSQLDPSSDDTVFVENFMRRMITLLDGFERILNLARRYPPSEELDNWLKSIETIYFRLLNILQKYGLKSIDTIGKEVNLNCHDVVEYRTTTDYPADTVISERQKGYTWNDKLIRDAKVVVAHNPAAS